MKTSTAQRSRQVKRGSGKRWQRQARPSQLSFKLMSADSPMTARFAVSLRRLSAAWHLMAVRRVAAALCKAVEQASRASPTNQGPRRLLVAPSLGSKILGHTVSLYVESRPLVCEAPQRALFKLNVCLGQTDAAMRRHHQEQRGEERRDVQPRPRAYFVLPGLVIRNPLIGRSST